MNARTRWAHLRAAPFHEIAAALDEREELLDNAKKALADGQAASLKSAELHRDAGAKLDAMRAERDELLATMEQLLAVDPWQSGSEWLLARRKGRALVSVIRERAIR